MRRPSSRLEAVACHPKQGVVAVGFADGLVLLVRTDDGAEILARKPGGAPVTALAWNGDGKLLAFGTEAARPALSTWGEGRRAACSSS